MHQQSLQKKCEHRSAFISSLGFLCRHTEHDVPQTDLFAWKKMFKKKSHNSNLVSALIFIQNEKLCKYTEIWRTLKVTIPKLTRDKKTTLNMSTKPFFFFYIFGHMTNSSALACIQVMFFFVNKHGMFFHKSKTQLMLCLCKHLILY